MGRLLAALLVGTLLSPSAGVAQNPVGGEIAEGRPIPVVQMDYSPVFDAICAELTGDEIPDEWRLELFDRSDEFEDRWRRDGPALLRATVEIVGRTFPFREIHAALVLCGVPSMSLPLILNMRHYPHLRPRR